jgi:hypothetical protein
VAALVLLWALYRVRLHQIAQRVNARLEERTRIVRELHEWRALAARYLPSTMSTSAAPER